jgi:hypothetical protein
MCLQDEEEEEEGEALVAARTQLQALQLELLKVPLSHHSQ